MCPSPCPLCRQGQLCAQGRVSNLTDCPQPMRGERERLVRNIGIEYRRVAQPWPRPAWPGPAAQWASAASGCWGRRCLRNWRTTAFMTRYCPKAQGFTSIEHPFIPSWRMEAGQACLCRGSHVFFSGFSPQPPLLTEVKRHERFASGQCDHTGLQSLLV